MRSKVEDILHRDEALGPRLRAALSSSHWRHWAAPSRAEDWIVEVVKYRPARRLCLQLLRGGATADRYMMKIWYNRRGARVYENLIQLNRLLQAEDESAPRIPLPLFYDEEAHALVYQRIDGRPLTSMLRRGLSRDWVERVVRAIHWLHCQRLPQMASRTPENEVQSVLSQGTASANSLMASVLDQLPGLLFPAPPLPSERALLHRDFYDQQIFISPDQRLVLIDLDDMAYGDPMLDLGNFMAHVAPMAHWRRRPEKLARLRGRLLRGYARLAGRSPEAFLRRLAWYEAVALSRQAVIQVQRGNPALAPGLLQSAGELLGLPDWPLLQSKPRTGGTRCCYDSH